MGQLHQNQHGHSTRCRWQLVELLAGDVLVADDTVLLRHAPPTSTYDSTSNDERVDGPVINRDVIYDELSVLRSCAESHMQPKSKKSHTGMIFRSHVLWMGLHRERQALRWWWW